MPTLRPGAAITLSRNGMDWLVTEFGVVNLCSTNIRERAERLISIVHPKFCEALRAQAEELLYLV